MDEAFETRLRQRFARAEPVAAGESFVLQLRLQRVRQARRSVLLRRLFVVLLLGAVLCASPLLLPWVVAVLHETGSLLTRILEGPRSLGSVVLPLAIAGASAIGAWAWGQASQRD
jgi:hypothetical protein